MHIDGYIQRMYALHVGIVSRTNVCVCGSGDIEWSANNL